MLAAGKGIGMLGGLVGPRRPGYSQGQSKREKGHLDQGGGYRDGEAWTGMARKVAEVLDVGWGTATAKS